MSSSSPSRIRIYLPFFFSSKSASQHIPKRLMIIQYWQIEKTKKKEHRSILTLIHGKWIIYLFSPNKQIPCHQETSISNRHYWCKKDKAGSFITHMFLKSTKLSPSDAQHFWGMSGDYDWWSSYKKKKTTKWQQTLQVQEKAIEKKKTKK